MYIRCAELKDDIQLAPLLSQLGYPQETNFIHHRLKIYSNEFNQGVYVAEVQNKIVGLIAYIIYDIFLKPGKRCQIEALVIDQQYRGQGIGKKLIKHLESVAYQKGVIVIDLLSGKRRAASGTHDFYRSLGYKNEGENTAKIHLRKEL